MTTVSPPSAVAAYSIYGSEYTGETVLLYVNLTGFSLGLVRVITGAIVSCVTVTVLMLVPVFPLILVAVYVTV